MCTKFEYDSYKEREKNMANTVINAAIFMATATINAAIFRELPASKEAGFRRRQSKETGFELAGSLFSCLSG